MKITPEFGRGLYAGTDMRAQMLLFTAELLVLSPEDTVKVNDTGLKFYLYNYDNTRDCMVLGDGELFNHSDTPNIGYKIMDYADHEVMVFYTLRPIELGEQLFIDYGADAKIDIKEYMNKNLMG
jgi:hypothetical protein